MDWIIYANWALVAVTVIFGGFGWLAPRYTMQKVDLRDGGSTMGTGEVRAASGALFVMAGLGALWLATPAAYAMIGFIWAGGALGRVTSLIADGTPGNKWVFFACEVVVAAAALWINLPLL
jgi:hypothetical protein